jgi:hypothetical protein
VNAPLRFWIFDSAAVWLQVRDVDVFMDVVGGNNNLWPLKFGLHPDMTFPRACCWPLYYWLFMAESPPHGGVSKPEVHERDK